MLKFEVTDLVEARRAKTAQYNGIEKILQFNGQTIAGVVTSVFEDRSQTLPKWIVRVRPAPERKTLKKLNLQAPARSSGS